VASRSSSGLEITPQHVTVQLAADARLASVLTSPWLRRERASSSLRRCSLMSMSTRPATCFQCSSSGSPVSLAAADRPLLRPGGEAGFAQCDPTIDSPWSGGIWPAGNKRDNGRSAEATSQRGGRPARRAEAAHRATCLHNCETDSGPVSLPTGTKASSRSVTGHAAKRSMSPRQARRCATAARNSPNLRPAGIAGVLYHRGNVRLLTYEGIRRGLRGRPAVFRAGRSQRRSREEPWSGSHPSCPKITSSVPTI
jgi:hypothetical protein